MERSSTAREVLIAELMGDMGKLLGRVDAVTPAIDGACREVTAAAHELAASVTPFKVRIAEIAAQTEKKSVQDMRSALEEATRQLLRIQTQAMTTSARAMFDKEVGPPLHQLASNLQRLIQQTRIQQTRQPWEGWATHAATATVTAILSAMLVLNVVYRATSPVQATERPVSGAASDSGVDPVRQEQRTPEGDASRSVAASSPRRLKGR